MREPRAESASFTLFVEAKQATHTLQTNNSVQQHKKRREFLQRFNMVLQNWNRLMATPSIFHLKNISNGDTCNIWYSGFLDLASVRKVSDNVTIAWSPIVGLGAIHRYVAKTTQFSFQWEIQVAVYQWIAQTASGTCASEKCFSGDQIHCSAPTTQRVHNRILGWYWLRSSLALEGWTWTKQLFFCKRRWAQVVACGDIARNLLQCLLYKRQTMCLILFLSRY